jgi:hypothetical protein
MKRVLKAVMFCSAVACLFGGGCGAKEYLNCRSICSKKGQCGTNSNYDVDSCASKCSDSANSDPDYARKVDTCKECVDPLSCTDPKLLVCFINCPSL